MIGKNWKITNFPEAVGCETKTSFPFSKFKLASFCVSLNLSKWNRSNTHFEAERNSSALTSAMLDTWITEWTNHREACSIRAGLAVTVQKVQWADQWSRVWSKDRGLKKRPEIEPKKTPFIYSSVQTSISLYLIVKKVPFTKYIFFKNTKVKLGGQRFYR